MKQCCADVVVEMQADVEAGKWLKLFLAATPFILLLPDLIPAGSAGEAAQAVAEKMATMAADQVLGNINKGMAKPDFVTAIQAVDVIILGNLSGYAASHMVRHIGTKDGNVWSRLAEAYSPTQKRGNNGNGEVNSGEGWFPWSWFE
jgi:hypothetical protein